MSHIDEENAIQKKSQVSKKQSYKLKQCKEKELTKFNESFRKFQSGRQTRGKHESINS